MREFAYILRELVRAPHRGRLRHRFGKPDKLFYQFEFLRLLQMAEGRHLRIVAGKLRRVELLFRELRFFEDVRGADRGVLRVIDGILLRALLGEVEIEVHVRIKRLLKKEPARSVQPHLLDKLFERHEDALALGHLELLAALHEPHRLHRQHLHASGVESERLERALETGPVAVVVRTEDIYARVEFPRYEPVAVVRDVRKHIGRRAVAPHEDTVLRIAVRGGLEPNRAILLVHGAALCKFAKHFANETFFVDAFFLEEDIECYLRLLFQEIGVLLLDERSDVVARLSLVCHITKTLCNLLLLQKTEELAVFILLPSPKRCFAKRTDL